MKRLSAGAVLLLLLCSASAYSSSEILFVSPQSLVSPPAGGESGPFAVTNLGAGRPIAYSASTAAAWITLSTAGGTSPGAFTITTSANGTGTARDALVTIAASGITGSPRTILVTQEAVGSADSYEPDNTVATTNPIIVGNEVQT